MFISCKHAFFYDRLDTHDRIRWEWLYSLTAHKDMFWFFTPQALCCWTPQTGVFYDAADTYACTLSPKAGTLFNAIYRYLLFDGQHQIVNIPSHAKTADNGLLRKRLEDNLCWIVCHVSRTTKSIKGLNWTQQVCMYFKLQYRYVLERHIQLCMFFKLKGRYVPQRHIQVYMFFNLKGRYVLLRHIQVCKFFNRKVRYAL